jgi:predicted MFS family arabinose efflux permease
MQSDASGPVFSERALVFLIGAIQFINILDFMVVMPLGPDFARDLAIPTSRLGLIAGAYTAAAATAGLLGAFVLDRFERRRALSVALFGLVLGTLMCGFARGLTSLILARLVAGFFGGPATSLSLSIVADAVPEERRGKALGAVMGAVSVAQVVGVPASLRLARALGWRASFIALAIAGALINAGALFLLPPIRAHLRQQASGARSAGAALLALVRRPLVRRSYLMTATVMAAGFLVLPNLSAYVQRNLGLPRDQLENLYMLGGLATFCTLRVAGRFVDKYGSFRVICAGAALFIVIQYFLLLGYDPRVPLWLVFIFFMIALSSRNVAHSTLASKVPASSERARFMSLQSTVQHLASSLGAILSARMLTELPDGKLAGMPLVALCSMTLTALLPLVVHRVERGVRSAVELGPKTGV